MRFLGEERLPSTKSISSLGNTSRPRNFIGAGRATACSLTHIQTLSPGYPISPQPKPQLNFNTDLLTSAHCWHFECPYFVYVFRFALSAKAKFGSEIQNSIPNLISDIYRNLNFQQTILTFSLGKNSLENSCFRTCV